MGKNKKKASKKQLETQEKKRREAANLAAIERQNAEAEKKRAEKAAKEAEETAKKKKRKKRIVQTCVGVILVGAVCTGAFMAREASLPESYKTLRAMSTVSETSGNTETALLENTAKEAGAKDVIVWQQTSESYDDMILMLVTYPEDADDWKERWTETSYVVDATTNKVRAIESTSLISQKDYIQKKIAAELDDYIDETGVEKSYQITKCNSGMVVVFGKDPSTYADAMGYIIRDNPDASQEEQFKLLKKHFQQN